MELGPRSHKKDGLVGSNCIINGSIHGPFAIFVMSDTPQASSLADALAPHAQRFCGFRLYSEGFNPEAPAIVSTVVPFGLIIRFYTIVS